MIEETEFCYYVYAYFREDGTPYYIGKGKRSRHVNKKHSCEVPKDKKYIKKIAENLSEIGALSIERRMIRWYGLKADNTGILENKTYGRGGVCGALQKAHLNHRYGKKWSEEEKQKRSKTLSTKTVILIDPEGVRHEVTGMRAFCKEHKINRVHLYHFGKTKGWLYLGENK